MTQNNEQSPVDESNEAMLSELDARILGGLMEKQLTTPDVYPLTLNSLVTACNQKTCREPAMNLSNAAVQSGLNALQSRDLVEVEYGSRANKYLQKLTRQLHMDKPEHAIFCLMLLRGPQTVNELFSRSSRLFEFGTADEVLALLEHHITKLKPLIVKLPHQSGQREDRYTHLLCGEPDIEAFAQASSNSKVSNIEALTQRVEMLEAQVALLMAKFEE